MVRLRVGDTFTKSWAEYRCDTKSRPYRHCSKRDAGRSCVPFYFAICTIPKRKSIARSYRNSNGFLLPAFESSSAHLLLSHVENLFIVSTLNLTND